MGEVRRGVGSVLRCGVGEERSGERCRGGLGDVEKYGRR